MQEEAIVYHHSPIGIIEIKGSSKGISSIQFEKEKNKKAIHAPSDLLKECVEQLDAYFLNKNKTFSLPLDMQGTPFQQKVWQALLDIPFGTTISYKEQAKRCGDVLAIRAVANANAKNKLAIVIPCHRVIGSDGSLTGYASGIERKKWLLHHEKALIIQEQLSLF